MTPEQAMAGATLLILWTSSILGLAAWISKQFTLLRADFDAKHKENSLRYDRINMLVIRHETLLNTRRGHG